jgi:hypothetical protein
VSLQTTGRAVTGIANGVVRMGAALAVLMLWGSVPASASASATWYVSASAPAGGTGSGARPFATLAAVEQASGPGDTIVVLPSPASTPPLQGGIALKSDQKLTGGGPAVTGLHSFDPAPRIANTTATHDSGDAVRLADADEVSNIAIVGSYRGGIYGKNVASATIVGNDLTGTNTSCTTGFVVQEFTLPTQAPGVGIPFSSGLPNGWAAVLVDESAGTAGLRFSDNHVHDAGCADGIDVRASGTADITATVTGSVLTHLKQGVSQQSVLAIGMQAIGRSRLRADLDGNAESYVGNATVGDQGNSDSEGLFANTAGSSHLTEHITNNADVHGLGSLSANCLEVVASNGNPKTDVSLSNSSCKDIVGDQIEEVNLTANSKMNLTVDHVRAQTSEFVGGPGFHQAEPGDDGDCLFMLASGAHTTTTLHVSNSIFTGCMTDGLEVAATVDSGSGPIDKLTFDVSNSQITGNALSNLRVLHNGPVTEFAGRIANTDLSNSPGTPIILENLSTTSPRSDLRLDLGGGTLGSPGNNCINGGNPFDIQDLRDDIFARHDWWGQPGGPSPGRVVTAGGHVDTAEPLGTPACGPVAGTTLGPLPATSATPARASLPPRLSIAGSCRDRRHFVFTLHHPPRERVVRAVVYLDGKVIRRVRGHNLTRLALRVPRRTFTLKIRTTTNTGATATSVRRYSACKQTPP